MTVADVVLGTGLSLQEAEATLNELARQRYVDLQVSPAGVLVYHCFPLSPAGQEPCRVGGMEPERRGLRDCHHSGTQTGHELTGQIFGCGCADREVRRRLCMDLGLAGKVALMTGGSRGIGVAIATAFAQKGTHVSICGRTPTDLSNATQCPQDEGRGNFDGRG